MCPCTVVVSIVLSYGQNSLQEPSLQFPSFEFTSMG